MYPPQPSLHNRFAQAILLLAIVFLTGLFSLHPISAAPKTKTPVPTAGIPTNTPSANCYKPLAVTSEIDGYAEGNLNPQGKYMTGKATVYNFATFQRKNFSSKMDVGNTAPRNAGNYVEVIDGFVTNQAEPTDFTQFRSQYEIFASVQIQLVNTSLPADAPIWAPWSSLPGRLGTVHYSTSPDQNPAPISISGDQAFLELARRVTFTPGVSGRIGFFSAVGGNKSYIVNCLVDIPTLLNDIRTGDGTQTAFGVSVAAWREAVAQAAQAAAEDYNNRVLNGEPTPTPAP